MAGRADRTARSLRGPRLPLETILKCAETDPFVASRGTVDGKGCLHGAARPFAPAPTPRVSGGDERSVGTLVIDQPPSPTEGLRAHLTSR
jgi:hypothetical protein